MLQSPQRRRWYKFNERVRQGLSWLYSITPSLDGMSFTACNINMAQQPTDAVQSPGAASDGGSHPGACFHLPRCMRFWTSNSFANLPALQCGFGYLLPSVAASNGLTSQFEWWFARIVHAQILHGCKHHICPDPEASSGTEVWNEQHIGVQGPLLRAARGSYLLWLYGEGSQAARQRWRYQRLKVRS